MKLIALILLSITFLNTAMSQPAPTPRPIRVIQLRGHGLERGRQHGKELKQEIAAVMALWKTELERIFQQPASAFIADFLKTTQYAEAIQTHTPDLWEEVKGIAEGSGQPFDDVLAFQLLDEYWVRADSLRHASEKHHCSSMGVPARNGLPTHLAQNMDLEGWMEGYQVVIRIRQHEEVPGQLLLTCAGLIGLTGMNNRGVGVCVNTLMQLRADTDGLPVAFMVRGLLACGSPEDALSFLQQTPHASGQNYILGLGESVRDFEASANTLVELPPDPNGMVYHTNHPLVNTDLKPWHRAAEEARRQETEKETNSEARFSALRQRMMASPAPDDEDLKATLRSRDNDHHPICRSLASGNNAYTFGSVILTLTGKLGMQVTAGPPDESAYQSFHFYIR